MPVQGPDVLDTEPLKLVEAVPQPLKVSVASVPDAAWNVARLV